MCLCVLLVFLIIRLNDRLVLIAWLTEVNLLWAAHQAHHSADDYNFTTALRQSIFLKFFSWVSDIHRVLSLSLSDLNKI